MRRIFVNMVYGIIVSNNDPFSPHSSIRSNITGRSRCGYHQTFFPGRPTEIGNRNTAIRDRILRWIFRSWNGVHAHRGAISGQRP